MDRSRITALLALLLAGPRELAAIRTALEGNWETEGSDDYNTVIAVLHRGAHFLQAAERWNHPYVPHAES